jgi:hypothetical protein
MVFALTSTPYCLKDDVEYGEFVSHVESTIQGSQ